MTQKDMLINKTITYIEDQLNTLFTLIEIAEQVHYSHYHLNQLFQIPWPYPLPVYSAEKNDRSRQITEPITAIAVTNPSKRSRMRLSSFITYHPVNTRFTRLLL